MNLNIYINKVDKQRLEELQALLKAVGVVYQDNRGNDSISALFRALVAEKLDAVRREHNRSIADPDAPYPEDDPWDEMGFPAPRS